MMGRKSGQMQLVVMDLEDLIPEKHLLRGIDLEIDFSFIYTILQPYYSPNGRPSGDPVCMFKMLLVGYLYGIKSERRLVEEIQLNIAYRRPSAKPECGNGGKATCLRLFSRKSSASASRKSWSTETLWSLLAALSHLLFPGQAG